MDEGILDYTIRGLPHCRRPKYGRTSTLNHPRMKPYKPNKRALAEVAETLSCGTLTWVKLTHPYVKELIPDVQPNDRWFEGIGNGWRIYVCETVLRNGFQSLSAYATGVTWGGKSISFLPLEPAHAEEAFAQIRQMPSEKPLLAKTRILVVEDEPAECRQITKWLNAERDFYVCHAVPTAGDAINLIPDLKPDIIITGLVMPGIDGFVFTEIVSNIWPSLHVLVLSLADEIVLSILPRCRISKSVLV